MVKRILTIGRNSGCDICISDSTDVVSREHAILEIGRGGRYFLTDKSRNGTYVNGIKMMSNERIPVTRADVVSFAHVSDLDWALVPKDNTGKIWAGVIVGLVVLALGGWGLHAYLQPASEKINLSGGSEQTTDDWKAPELVPENQSETESEDVKSEDGSDVNEAIAPKTEKEQPRQQKPEKPVEKPQSPIDAIY